MSYFKGTWRLEPVKLKTAYTLARIAQYNKPLADQIATRFKVGQLQIELNQRLERGAGNSEAAQLTAALEKLDLVVAAI